MIHQSRSSFATHQQSASIFVQIVFDLIAIWASIACARLIRWYFLDFPNTTLLIEWSVDLFRDRLWQFGLLSIVIVLIFLFQGQYTSRRSSVFYLQKIILLLAVMMLVDFAIAHMLKQEYPRLWSLLTWGICPVFLFLSRVLSIKFLEKLNWWKVKACCICDHDGQENVTQLLDQNGLSGYEISDFLLDDTLKIKDENLTKLKNLPSTILISFGLKNQDYAKALSDRLLEVGHQVILLPNHHKLPMLSSHIEPVFGDRMFLLHLKNPFTGLWAQRIKRFIDLVAGSLLFIGASPIFLVTASWIFLIDGRQVIYSQKRLGQNGKSFSCYKLRTMRHGSETILKEWQETNPNLWEEYQNHKKLRHDPRLLKGAHFIRRYSIDELPQLVNVIRGDMSLIGPRPILLSEREEYGEAIELYENITPGMTGLWQVTGRNQTSFERRVELDLWYIRNWSLWLDIIILLKTFKVIISGQGERRH